MKRALALLLLPFLLLAACGDDDTQTGDTTADGSSTTSAAGGSTTAPVDLPAGVTITSVSDDLAAKPEIELEPSDTAPTEVIIEDTVVGDGAEVAEGDTVEVQYVGMLTDGTQFDASWDNGGQPIEFGLDQVIAGWGEGLIGMKAGGRRVLVIPAEKGYGETGQGTIPPNAALIFVVDLISVVEPPTAGVTISEVSDDLTAKPEYVLEPSDTAPTEIVIDDVVVGTGEALPDGDPRVRMHVIEMLTNGTEVASTWEVDAAEFNLSQVIPGFPEGVAGMKVGGRRTIIIPAEQAYGAEGTPDGSIPPDSTMVYIVDLLEIVDPTAATTSSTAGQ